MTDVVEAKALGMTHAIRRRWDNTETLTPIVDTKEPDKLTSSAEGPRASRLGVLTFISGAEEFGTAQAGVETLLVSSPRDQADAIFEAPGADLSEHLRRALPVLAVGVPCEELIPPEVFERLLNCNPLIAAQRLRHSVSISVELPADKWMAQVRAWASSHLQTNHVVDDSREGIYGDRG